MLTFNGFVSQGYERFQQLTWIEVPGSLGIKDPGFQNDFRIWASLNEEGKEWLLLTVDDWGELPPGTPEGQEARRRLAKEAAVAGLSPGFVTYLLDWLVEIKAAFRVVGALTPAAL